MRRQLSQTAETVRGWVVSMWRGSIDVDLAQLRAVALVALMAFSLVAGIGGITSAQTVEYYEYDSDPGMQSVEYPTEEEGQHTGFVGSVSDNSIGHSIDGNYDENFQATWNQSIGNYHDEWQAWGMGLNGTTASGETIRLLIVVRRTGSGGAGQRDSVRLYKYNETVNGTEEAVIGAPSDDGDDRWLSGGFQVQLEYNNEQGTWTLRVLDTDGTEKYSGSEVAGIDLGDEIDPVAFDMAFYSGPDNIALETSNSRIRHESTSGTAGTAELFSGSLDIEEPTSVSDGGDSTPEEPNVELQLNRYMEHGSTQNYTVVYKDANGDRQDVTDVSTVTSNNTTVVTVDEANSELTATSDTSINGTSEITAEYNGESVTRTVTVANATLDNAEILPGATRAQAIILDDGIFFLIILALLVIPFTRVSSAFGGLAMGQLVVSIGWFGGYLSNGLAMVSVFCALFIGFNLAANIDYTVRR